MLFGVAGGLAEHFDVDPVLVRLAFVVLCFANLVGLIAYVALVIIMPRGEAADTAPPEANDTPPMEGSGQGPRSASGEGRSRNFLALILISIGALILMGIAVIAVLFTFVSDPLGGSREIAISQVISMAARGQIESIEVKGDNLDVTTTSRESLTSRKEEGASVVEILERSGVDPVASNIEITVRGSSGWIWGISGWLLGLSFITLLPLLLIGVGAAILLGRARRM